MGDGDAPTAAGAAGPGWHPDPADPWRSLRWWDGATWTNDTRSVPSAAPPGVSGVPQRVFAAGQGVGWWQRNRTTGTVLLVVAAYLVLAATTGIVLLGIAPVMMSVSAVRRREPLAFVAVGAAVLAVVVAVSALAH